jgi:hypothetical protein
VEAHDLAKLFMLEGMERATRKRSSETSRKILHVKEVLKEGLIK